MNSLIFARVDVVNTAGHFMDDHKDINDAGLQLSTGHYLFTTNRALKSQGIKKHDWRFFITNGQGRRMQMMMSEPIDSSELKEHDTAFLNLTSSAQKMCKTLERLSISDRVVVLKAAGVVLGAGATIAAALATYQALTSWEPTNCAIGLGATALLGTVTYLNYECLSDQLKASAKACEQYEQARKRYALTIRKYFPIIDDDPLKILNERHETLCTKLRKVMTSRLTTEAFTNPNYAVQVA